MDPYSVTRNLNSLFRIVPAELFLAEFASDRSHMVSLNNPGSCFIYVLAKALKPFEYFSTSLSFSMPVVYDHSRIRSKDEGNST